MELLDDFAWRDADGRHEESRLFLDDHVDELRQLATCIIMLNEMKHVDPVHSGLHETTYVGFARTATDLWNEQIDTKWCIGVLQVFLQGFDLRVIPVQRSAT